MVDQGKFSRNLFWQKAQFYIVNILKFCVVLGLISIKYTYNACAFLVPNLNIDISIHYIGYKYNHFPNSMTLRFSERSKILCNPRFHAVQILSDYIQRLKIDRPRDVPIM